MAKLIKTLSFMLLLNIIHAYGMEDQTKDPRLLLGLPDDVFKVIINYAKKDSVFKATKLLIRLSWVCKKFEYLRRPDTIKTTLNLNQETVDNTFETYAFLKRYNRATCEEDTPFLKLLIAMNAHPKPYYKTLIKCVKYTTNSYIVEHFITYHDNNVNQQDEDGETPLRKAVNLDMPNIVRVLLKHNANMYLADNNGKIPMNVALQYDRIECIKALIECGIDTTIKYFIYSRLLTKDDEPCEKIDFHTIAEWAKEHEHHEIYKLVTGKEIPKPWDAVSELLTDTCVIS